MPDANVLLGMPLRDTLLRAAEVGLYRPVWTREIWDEVIRHLRDPDERTHPLTDADAARLLAAVDRAFPNAHVSRYHRLIRLMTNDPKDRHVAAVAVHARAQVIITYNLKHFPVTALEPHGVSARHPDAFLLDLFTEAPDLMARVIQEQAAALRRRPTTPRHVLDKLEQVGMTHFVASVRAYLALA